MTSRAETAPQAEGGRAQIIGTGLIGGSVGMALRSVGWHVTGSDRLDDVAAAALGAGAIDEVGIDPDAELIVICTPSSQVAEVANALLAASSDPRLMVTDVAGVKAPIVRAVDDPRFIGGHPMAGSEQLGVAGARSDLFLGATWVLTPGPDTPAETYGRLLSVVRSLGAQGVALSAADHDRLVAHVSHVPHLVASALMNEAASVAESDAALLESLDALGTQLAHLRHAIATEDRSAIGTALSSASTARRSLPGRSVDPDQLAEVRIPVPDRAGVLAEVTATASELGLSVVDVDIAHSIEGGRGVLIVVVAHSQAQRYATALRERGFICSVVDR